jgi:predicted dithiol-disulfide oxidoreductase (DUF899 family)
MQDDTEQDRVAGRMARLAQAHLRNEKALTRMRDLVAAERRALPWVKVGKQYVFDTPEGKRSLAEHETLLAAGFPLNPGGLPAYKTYCPMCRANRIGLDQAVSYVRKGDTLVVWRLDRTEKRPVILFK